MDTGLFIAGLVGALAFLLLVRQNPIPEFVPLYDTADASAELIAGKARNAATQEFITRNRELFENAADAVQRARWQQLYVEGRNELKDSYARQNRLELQLLVSQAFARLVGVAVYGVAGGVVAAFLAGRLPIQGLAGDLNGPLQAFAIGSAWSAYLSVAGIRLGQSKLDAQLDAAAVKAASEIDQLRSEIRGKDDQEQDAAINRLAASVGARFVGTKQALRNSIR